MMKSGRRGDRFSINSVSKLVGTFQVIVGILVVIRTMAAAHGETLSAGRLTPVTLRPAAIASGNAIILPGIANIDVTAGTDLKITLGHVDIIDGLPALYATEAAITSELTGRTITVGKLYAAAAALEKAYADAGYSFTRVYIPKQKIVDHGTVRLTVVQGFVEGLNLTALPDGVRDLVRQRLEQLVHRTPLQFKDIERALLLAGDLAGLTLHSTVVRGKDEGGMILVIDGTLTSFAAHVNYDNNQSSRLGSASVSTNISLNNPLGLGDQVYVSWNGDQVQPFSGKPLERVLGGGLVVPIGVDGLTLNPEVTVSQTNPKVVTGVPVTRSSMTRGSLRAAYPLIRSNALDVTISSALEAIDEPIDATTLGTTLSHDRYVASRSGLDWRDQITANLSATGTLTYSQGLAGRSISDITASGIPLSHAGATSEFHKLVLTSGLRYQADALDLTTSVRAQTTFGKPILYGEAFAFEGQSALSAFLPGALSSDEGATIRSEAGWTTTMPGADTTMRPYVFAALGGGINRNPTSAEPASFGAEAFGLGTQVFLATAPGGPKMTLALEAAHYTSSVTPLAEGNRFSLALAFQY